MAVNKLTKGYTKNIKNYMQSESLAQKEQLEAEIKQLEIDKLSQQVILEKTIERLERKQQALKSLINYLNHDAD